jgi:hypothetical protein
MNLVMLFYVGQRVFGKSILSNVFLRNIIRKTQWRSDSNCFVEGVFRNVKCVVKRNMKRHTLLLTLRTPFILFGFLLLEIF